MKELNQYLRVIVVILVAVAASYAVVHPHVADVSSSDHGTVSEEGTIRFYSGLFLGINPDPGYRASVYVDGELADYDGSGTFLYRTNVFDFDTHKIHVNFERISSLYVHHNAGGSVSPDGNVFATGEVRIIATPDEGYVIEDFIINGVSKGSINIVDIIVSEPMDVMVKFRPVDEEDHTVNISVTSSVSITDDYGTIIPNGKFMIPAGGSFVISVSLNPGYELKQINVNGIPYLNTLVALFANDVSGQKDSVDIRVDDVDENMIVEVVIEKIIEPGDSYVINISSGEGGKTDPSGEVTVNKGDDLTINLIPDTGYTVCSIIIDGKSYEVSGDSYVLRNVTKNMVISVEFAKVPVNLVGIKIISEPDKTSYIVGDPLDTTGLKVNAIYSDGTFNSIPCDELNINPVKFVISGNQAVTVTYKGFSESFEVTVKDVTDVFNVTVKSVDGNVVNKRLSEYEIRFGAFEPGKTKNVVLEISVDGLCNAYLRLSPILDKNELTDRIVVTIDGEKRGSLTELFSSQISLGVISGSEDLTIEFSFPPGIDGSDNEALGKSAAFKMSILAESR